MATTTVQALKNADGNKIYPKTIADAVAYDSTRTVKGMLSNSVFCERVKTVENSDFPINATTLNGHTSDYFATVEDLANIASGDSVVDLGDGDTLKDYVKIQGNAGFHNSIYRGKDITSYLTDGSLFTRISSVIFDDLFIGDYFTMNITVDGYTVQCNKYVLCGFDIYLNSTVSIHHAVVMPETVLFTESINASDVTTTEGGYYNSNMQQIVLPKVATGIKAIIGEHLISHSDVFSTKAVDGKASEWDWKPSNIRLCSEMDVFGSIGFGNPFDMGASNKQLPIFRLNPSFMTDMNNKYTTWMMLSTIAFNNAYSACCPNGSFGYVNSNDTSEKSGIRPRFLID